MQFELTEREQDVLEEQGWRLLDIETEGNKALVEIENWSPAGEDLPETIVVDEWDTFATATRKWAESFDKDDHVELWANMRGKRGVPSTIRELVEDAEAIQAMFNDLADAIEAIYDEIDEEADEDEEAMKTYRIPVVWQMYGTMVIEAMSKKEAIDKALHCPETPLPEGTYLDDSLEIDEGNEIEVES